MLEQTGCYLLIYLFICSKSSLVIAPSLPCFCIVQFVTGNLLSFCLFAALKEKLDKLEADMKKELAKVFLLY